MESQVQVFFFSPGIIYGVSEGETVLQDSPEQLKYMGTCLKRLKIYPNKDKMVPFSFFRCNPRL